MLSLALIPVALRRAPERLMRTNVSGRSVPAVLGLVLALSGAVGACFVAALDYAHWDAASTERVTLAVLLLVVVAAAAGLIDDLRGDETSRGFKGHLGAAARGRVTGGLVKIVLVGAAGLGAGALVSSGRGIVECALAVALSANLINLLDRAPGRALKYSLLLFIPLAFGSGPWFVASGGLLGGAIACLPPDLGERGMLGDAGSNALGSVLGLGLVLSVDEAALLVGLGVLVVLNAVSERWSFSDVISRTAPLRFFDSLGRRTEPSE
jgi:UDP-N-acetylmuramyl pentapeptide phosphotransferase/UDP-N-acetylglucosamine-1-phosphate transferase